MAILLLLYLLFGMNTTPSLDDEAYYDDYDYDDYGEGESFEILDDIESWVDNV